MHRSRAETNGHTSSQLKKKTKGLEGRGKLTSKLIDDLSIYYGLAIRRNHDSLSKMKNEIWATFCHKLSTDANPQHDKCPSGADSWCSWEKARATETLAGYKHKPAIPEKIFNAIKPVYEELSSDDLLTRCLGGFTQNNNQSFNSKVWVMAPKTVSSGKIIVDIAAEIAVCDFNDGLMSVMHIMQVLGITIGPNCYNYCMEADAHRIKFSERTPTEAAREARQALKEARKVAEEKNANVEGQMYALGIAE